MSHNDLDPVNWHAFRSTAHRMLDDMLAHCEHVRDRSVWQAPPEATRARFRASLPAQPSALETLHTQFLTDILPYGSGNTHPSFFGWVQGGGTPVGMLADMLAAGLNANLGGRDQMPLEVERQILVWMRELFSFPEGASGVFVTGSSQANMMALLMARRARIGEAVRTQGLLTAGPQLVAYTSQAAHGCIARAMDFIGLGSQHLRRVPVNEAQRMNLGELARMIEVDLAQGLQPFAIVGTAGTVDTGAIDDLAALADMAQHRQLWFHVDGAYGALGMFSPEVAPLLKGIERADSIAFDFHKWGQVPYDAGYLLARDGVMQQNTFASPAAYLSRDTRGMSAGSPWPCDLGPDLSRGFRALKVWFTLKTFGSQHLGQVIGHTCELARYLAQQVRQHPQLELLAPVSLNVVCFRYRTDDDVDGLNSDLVVALQESGLCAPSSTTINGQFAIRAAIVNHRTTQADIDQLIEQVLHVGEILQHHRKDSTR